MPGRKDHFAGLIGALRSECTRAVEANAASLLRGAAEALYKQGYTPKHIQALVKNELRLADRRRRRVENSKRRALDYAHKLGA